MSYVQRQVQGQGVVACSSEVFYIHSQEDILPYIVVHNKTHASTVSTFKSA